MWHTSCAAGSSLGHHAALSQQPDLQTALTSHSMIPVPHDPRLPCSAELLEDEVKVDEQLMTRTSVSQLLPSCIHAPVPRKACGDFTNPNSQSFNSGCSSSWSCQGQGLRNLLFLLPNA